ncbi:MAG: tRNA (adenosine(37)-N6)-threonylcarbamoyltransferase complex dimerization subunit type 1 TsaB [Bacteroidota bacterium]
MKILGIETATIVCGAAVVVDETVLSEEQIAEKNVHAENIMRLIDEVLKQSHLSLNELDAVAVSIGPGSFTGLRIGLSVTKGLVYATGKPLVAVPTLRALAQRAVDAGVVETQYILPAIDARRDEVYCQLFRFNGTSIEPEWEERDLWLSRLFDEIGERSISVTGDAIHKIQVHQEAKRLRFVTGEFASCSAGTVAMVGEQMACMNKFVDAGTVEPKYVKEFYSTCRSN